MNDASPAAPVQIQLLGPFEVRRAGAPVPAGEWRGQKTRDLLKILVLARGRYVAKDQLVEWLWPAAEPGAAEASLRSAVSELRRLLEPGLARGRDSTYVLTHHEGYSFNVESQAVVDWLDCERALQATARRTLEAALSRCNRDLLENDPYAEWGQAERARLRGLRLDAWARLVDLCLGDGDCRQAAAAAEEGLRLDAGREGLWRGLMLAHHQCGDRAAALRAFDRCRTALARDLGTDPLPETLRLHQQILQDDSPAPAATLDSPAAAPRAAPAWLRRAGAVGLGVWVLLTGAHLALSLAGLVEGSFIGPGDPGAEALPRLLAEPQALRALQAGSYWLLPLGLLLLPSYLAWFALLRPGLAQAGRAPAWLGAGLGVLDVTAQALSRSVTAVQVTVLPAAYGRAPLAEQAPLETLWDVLQQFAAVFATLGAWGHPTAIALLSWATLAQARAGRPPLRWAQPLGWAGLAMAALTLVYTFIPPLPAPPGGWLLAGLALAALTYAWRLALAAALWD